MEEKRNTEAVAENEKKRSSKLKIELIIIISVMVALLLVAAPILVSCLGGAADEGEEFPPVDPSELEDTKEEDFDIMEYDEYLSLNRVVMLENRGMGTSVSIDESTYKNYDPAIELVYEMLNILIAGDYKAYNAIVSEDEGHFEWFSQQQIYDISMYEKSATEVEGKKGSYTEYVIVLTYKIHENNGSYRNNITSDSARPQYIVINDSTGKLMIMDIIDTRS